MKKIQLLIIEDEEAIRDMLQFSLRHANFAILTAENTEQASVLLANKIPDLILLDWMLPGKSGIEFIKYLRQQELLKNIPIIMLTAKAEEENKIKGLLTGADDYITKPFSIDELIARIKTVLRRGLIVSSDSEIKIANLVLNIDQHSLKINDETIALTKAEYQLLHFLMTHPNKTYSRDQLISYVYGRTIYIDERTIDVYVKRLRKKLKKYNDDHLIKTVRGMGYLFVREDV